LRRSEDARLELGAAAVALLDRVDHREGRHSLKQIAADGFPELSFDPDEIEHVVGDLERHAQVRAKRAERRDVVGLGVSEERGALTALRVQRSGLELDAVEVRGLARERSRRCDLAELAVAQGEYGLRD